MHHFGPPSSINNDTETIQPVIAALHMRQKSIFECYERIGNMDYAFIMNGHKLISPSLRRKMNQFNSLRGDEPT